MSSSILKRKKDWCVYSSKGNKPTISQTRRVRCISRGSYLHNPQDYNHRAHTARDAVYPEHQRHDTRVQHARTLSPPRTAQRGPHGAASQPKPRPYGRTLTAGLKRPWDDTATLDRRSITAGDRTLLKQAGRWRSTSRCVVGESRCMTAGASRGISTGTASLEVPPPAPAVLAPGTVRSGAAAFRDMTEEYRWHDGTFQTGKVGAVSYRDDDDDDDDDGSFWSCCMGGKDSVGCQVKIRRPGKMFSTSK
eukprot:gnl/Dysnectes_brevis/7707_a13203_352.p1 GENE.gnl/Dysnectes_brevis/7707_a13203_352~~gnl/Dysnectes_brevis/7707_a13203_352.p1  ORF type:complete len:249 (-),score=25.27 gnl/Dysnectes_brevis/7707_a13203_352:52-798(-)